jgi:hypothetical protein
MIRALEAELAALRAENSLLRAEAIQLRDVNASLTADNVALDAGWRQERELSAKLCAWGNQGWARVRRLRAWTHRLLRMARYWKDLAPKPPMSDRAKAIMMVRYVKLGGLERGKSAGAVKQLAAEFNTSDSTVNRCIREFKLRKLTKAEAGKLVLDYRRRYGD